MSRIQIFFQNRRVRNIAVQAFALFVFIAAIAMIAVNTASNLQRQGIASGFDFLDSTSGFDIIMHLIPYDERATYGRAFLVGLLNTLMISAIGVLIATLLGFLVGIARLSRNWLVSKAALVYVEVLRNVPLLLQIFFWYFAVLRTLPGPRESLSLFGVVFLNNRGFYLPSPEFNPGLTSLLVPFLVAISLWYCASRVVVRYREHTGKQLPPHLIGLGVAVLIIAVSVARLDMTVHFDVPQLAAFNFQGGMVVIPEFSALLLALSLYTASYIAEIVRAGILAVPKGQKEAAAALGLSRNHAMRLVIVPQAMRVIVPPLTSQYLNLAKNSSLAAAIAYPDLVLVFAGTVLMQTGQAVEVISITMAVYLCISLLISLVMNIYNRRHALIGG